MLSFGVAATFRTMWHGPWLARLAMDAVEQVLFGAGASASISKTQSREQCSILLLSLNNLNTSRSAALKRLPNGDLLSGVTSSSESGMLKDTRECGVGVRASLRAADFCVLNMVEGSCATVEADFGVSSQEAISESWCLRLAGLPSPVAPHQSVLSFSLTNAADAFFIPAVILCRKRDDALKSSLAVAIEDVPRGSRR